MDNIIKTKFYEVFSTFLKESWKEFSDTRVEPPTHNKFYEFMKAKISKECARGSATQAESNTK